MDADAATVMTTAPPSAFERNLAETEPRLYRLALHLTGNKDIAEEMMQIVRVKSFRFYGSYDHSSTFFTWAAKILVNSAKDYFRSESRRSLLHLDWEQDLEEDGLDGWDVPDPRQDLSVALDRVWLEDSLSGVSEYDLSLLTMKAEGVKWADYAADIGATPSSVRDRWARARERIVEVFGAETVFGAEKGMEGSR